MSTLDAPTTSVCHYGMKRLAILLPWRAASAVLLTVFAFINKAPAGELTARKINPSPNAFGSTVVAFMPFLPR